MRSLVLLVVVSVQLLSSHSFAHVALTNKSEANGIYSYTLLADEAEGRALYNKLHVSSRHSPNDVSDETKKLSSDYIKFDCRHLSKVDWTGAPKEIYTCNIAIDVQSGMVQPLVIHQNPNLVQLYIDYAGSDAAVKFIAHLNLDTSKNFNRFNSTADSATSRTPEATYKGVRYSPFSAECNSIGEKAGCHFTFQALDLSSK